MTQASIKGRVWVLGNAEGGLIENIDTDMIFHNRYLHITDPAQMGQHALDNLVGWENFAQKAQAGDIVLAGANFGCGSSRQGAVDCFRALGIQALVAVSFGAIYFRNAVNAGWPVLSCPELDPAVVATGDEVELDLVDVSWRNLTRGAALPALGRISAVQRQIMDAGGLLSLRSQD